ncbi:MAG: TPM domain-containing protein [Ignavibacteriales bacterium]|nr:TPM domain-containing protein [Ignavibacteriales bacterium]
MANLVKQFLSKQDLADIAGAIAEQEKRTAGELRVAIRQKRSRKEKALSVEQLARLEFVHLGMMKTEERTGVLIFILLEAREFFILADEHINEKVGPSVWQGVAQTMAARFATKEYRQGLLDAVREVTDHLASHFPARSGDKNELPNTVDIS